VLGPLFNDEFSDVYFALYALQAQGLPHRHLVLRAEDLRQRLLRVPGIEKFNIFGEQAQKIFVEISYQRLATLGITGQQLLAALANQNDVTPAGFVETAGPRVYLRLDGAIDGLDTIRNLPVAVGDRSIKLGDIAEVKRGYEDPKVFEIRNNGEPALMLGLVMKPGFNGLALGEALNAEEVAIHHELPTGITFAKITDQAKVIDDAIHEFMVKFFTALSVVIVVSLVALGFRVGIVVALAVPITLAAVFVVMMVTGRDFDRITLGALIILTAAAAMLTFIPLTHSVFWSALADVLIGGVGVGTFLTLLFLPALYALLFRVAREPRGKDALVRLETRPHRTGA
jgi:multidrug efflux pump subunit AcrB